MTTLTWRDVAAPDFRSSMEGYQQSSNLLNNAFSGLDRGLQRYDNDITASVNARILAQLAQVQDLAHAKTAAHDLLQGVDPRRVNPTTLTALMARPGQLLEQETGESNLEFSNYQRGRVRDRDTRLDAAGPDLSRALLADAAGNGDSARQILHDSTAVGGLRAEDLMPFLTGGQNLEKGNVDIAGGRISNRQAQQNYDQGATRFQWEVTNHDDQVAGQQAFQRVAQGAMTAEDAIAALGTMSLSPGAYAHAIQLLEPRFPGIIGSTGVGAPGGSVPAGPGNASAFDVVLGNGTYGRPSTPLTNMTIGQAHDFGQNVLERNSARAGVGGGQGSSAMGAFQITRSTLEDFAPRVLGPNWRNLPFNAENQDQIAEAIFNSARGSARELMGRWASLSQAQAEQIVRQRMPWSQVRQIIARGESGFSLPAAPNVANQALEGAVRGSQVNNAGNVSQWLANLGNSGSPTEIAARITSQQGPLNGVPRQFVSEQIARIRERSKVNGQYTLNPAQAARILIDNYQTEHSYFPSLYNTMLWAGISGDRNSTYTLPDGSRFNDRAITQAIEDARRGRYVDRAAEAQNIQQATQQLQAAQQRDVQAQAALVRARQRAVVSPQFAQTSLPRYEAEAQAARQALLMISRQVQPQLHANRVEESRTGSLIGDILEAAATGRR